MDCIKSYDKINSIKRTAFPALDLGKDPVRDAAYRLSGDAVTELFLKECAYLTSTVTDGIKPNNTFCE